MMMNTPEDRELLMHPTGFLTEQIALNSGSSDLKKTMQVFEFWR